jgi:tight adherence protein C
MPELSIETIKLLALIGTFGAISVAIYVHLRSREERAVVRSGLEDALLAHSSVRDSRAAVMRAPFGERVLGPIFRRAANIVYRFGPKGFAEQIQERLVLAGLSDRIDPDAFIAASALLPIVLLAFLFTYHSIGGTVPTLMWIIVPASAMFPKLLLTRRVEARQHKIKLALADTLDLLTIAVEAGLGFDAALARVVSSVPGPLSDELFRMLQELKIGVPRSQAFNNLSERTKVPELDQFITAMNQADAFGISIGNVLRVQSEQLRLKRSQYAEERAAKTPVKLLFPLLFCIFPGLFVVIVGPAAIQISRNLF